MMFGLTKREQRWAAEQKAAETLVPLFTAAIEARTAMDTNDRIITNAMLRAQDQERIAQLEADLAEALKTIVDLGFGEAKLRIELLEGLLREADVHVQSSVARGYPSGLLERIRAALGEET